jgi:hypothetical protein
LGGWVLPSRTLVPCYAGATPHAYSELVTGSDELRDEAARALGDVDERALFWVDVATLTHAGAGAENVDWKTLDWAKIRNQADQWLATLDPDTLSPQSDAAWLTWPVPGRDDVRFGLHARPRMRARGYKRQPSLVIAKPPPPPPLQFEDGETASLYELPIETVRQFAQGHRRLGIELVSHRLTWDVLLRQMEHFGQTNTSEIEPLLLEPIASALGLVEAPPDPLGDFDEGWRAVHDIDMPLLDDPRQD